MSINTFFVELERQAGLCRTVDIAERMGVKLGNGKPLLRYPSFTLGSMEVSPLSVAGAYATFANHGVYCKATRRCQHLGPGRKDAVLRLG